MSSGDIRVMQGALEHIETNILNPIVCPILSSVSSAPLRAALGVIQVVGGLATAFFGSLQINKTAEYYGIHHFTHGVLNLCRAVIEFIPFINLMTVVYDGGLGRTHRGLCDGGNHIRFSYISFEEALAANPKEGLPSYGNS